MHGSSCPRLLAPHLRPAAHDLPRLGLIVLATDLTIERDAARLIGWDEASVHVARMAFANPTTLQNLRALAPDIASAAQLLVPETDLRAIVFACTSASLVIGNGAIEDAVGRVRPHVPVVTPTTAALLALRAVGARRIALLTPYLPETTAPMAAYFRANGFDVAASACFGLADDRDMARLDGDALVEAAVALDSACGNATNGAGVDALFLSCTALPALDVIAAIEARIDKPVISSNQATFWLLRGLAELAMSPAQTGGTGRLFDEKPPSTHTQ